MPTKSRTMATYEALKADLLNGQYGSGTKIIIDQICQRFRVSPCAVREALSRLTSDGLVTTQPQRGFMAAPVSAADLIDLTSVRIEIESLCLRRAIEIGGLVWEGNIQNAWHQLEHTPMLSSQQNGVLNPAWVERHTVFHDSLVGACDSVWWMRLRDQMYIQAERYRRLAQPHPKTPRQPAAEHGAMVDAVLARNSDTACQLMAQHLQMTAEILLQSGAAFVDAAPQDLVAPNKISTTPRRHHIVSEEQWLTKASS
jgi:GntR family transcriptional regulator, carbon starvation induced regulator